VEKVKEVEHCCKIDVYNVDDDDPRDIQIKESEGECTLKGNATKMAHQTIMPPKKPRNTILALNKCLR
jgi:hypothetical protein